MRLPFVIWNSLDAPFAMAPAFQPVLQVVGPFPVDVANGYASAPPSVTTLTTQIGTLESEGSSAVSPLCGPNRAQLLETELTACDRAGPLTEAAGENEATSCLVDFEATTLEPSQPSG